MSKLRFIFSLLLFFYYSQLLVYCAKIPIIEIGIGTKVKISSKNNTLYDFVISEDQLKQGKFVVFSTNTEKYLKPAFIYISITNKTSPSPDDRDFSSQELGNNIIFVNNSYLQKNEVDSKYHLYVKILLMYETTVEFEVYQLNNIPLENYHGIRTKLILKDIIEPNIISFTYKNTEKKTKKKILFYSLGEHYKYFNMKIKYISIKENITEFESKHRFENGYSNIIDFNSPIFDEDENPKIYISLSPNDDKYNNKKIEIGYEIIDEKENEKREIEILEHIWGMTDNSENCYKFKENINETKKATMIINIFTQSIEFNIKDSNNDKIYSLDVFNNYFIRLPNLVFKKENYFCFKHITPKESEIEIYGETSYDFQIYYEDELKNYQIFIMPLINGKIYTHSLNSGDFMVYRHNYFGNHTEKDEQNLYSANMIRIRGNPELYGLFCTDYPDNCEINYNNIDDHLYFRPIYPLNIYSINKNYLEIDDIEFNIESDAMYEQRGQYLSVVYCQTEEKDPNDGECNYIIEINNERDEIQLIPGNIFATSIINPVNYFLIRLFDFKDIEYLKIYFTILIGNAELYIYEDSNYINEIKNYNYSGIHRKEIIEIYEDIKENYYLIVKCQDTAFIQLKYETNIDFKGYNNIIPNEINIEPINLKTNSYYNLYNPHYYYPLDNETRNNDFFYKLIPLDCSMTLWNMDTTYINITQFDFEMKKDNLYSYLSSYGFYSKVYNFTHTYSEDEKCSLIIYNGEISEEMYIFAISDMPHISYENDTYYSFPTFDIENNEQGIFVDFKIYNHKNRSKFYYSLIYEYPHDVSIHSIWISHNQTRYIYPQSSDNIFGFVNFHVSKSDPSDDYYMSINFMSSPISPEYISSCQTYDFLLVSHRNKYFYSKISKNSEGYLKFNFPDTTGDIEFYAKIVKKNEVEEEYNWNKRVKLPEKDDQNLLNINNSLITFDKNDTEKCEKGCEIYFQMKSFDEYAVLVNIDFQLSECNKEDKDETNPNNLSNEDEDKYLWVKIVIPIIIIIIIGVVVFLIIRKKRKYSNDNQKELTGFNIPLSNISS